MLKRTTDVENTREDNILSILLQELTMYNFYWLLRLFIILIPAATAVLVLAGAKHQVGVFATFMATHQLVYFAYGVTIILAGIATVDSPKLLASVIILLLLSMFSYGMGVRWLHGREYGRLKAAFVAPPLLALLLPFWLPEERRPQAPLGPTVYTSGGTFEVTEFLDFLSQGPLAVSIDPVAARELRTKHIRIAAPALRDVPLKYVLDEIVLKQLPGQWTYDAVGTTVRLKRR